MSLEKECKINKNYRSLDLYLYYTLNRPVHPIYIHYLLHNQNQQVKITFSGSWSPGWMLCFLSFFSSDIRTWRQSDNYFMGYIVEVISKTILKFPLLKFRTKSKIQPFDTWAVLKRKLHIIVNHLTMCDWKCSTYLQWNPPGVGYKLTGHYQRLSFFKLKIWT